MKYLPLVWSGLARRWGALLLTALTIALAFFLFGVLRGFVDGYLASIQERDQGMLRVFNKTRRGLPMPIAHRARLQTVEGVGEVVVFGGSGATNQQPSKRVWADATNAGGYLRIDDNYVASDEAISALTANRTGALAGLDFLAEHGLAVGDRLPVITNTPQDDGSRTWVFDIVGHFDVAPENWNSNWIVINYDYFDEARADGRGTANAFWLTVLDRRDEAAVAKRIDEVFQNSPVPTRTFSLSSEAETRLASLGGSRFFVNAVSLAAFLTILVVTGGVLLQATRERVPEYALLKALGFGSGAISALAMSEGVALCVASAAVGLGVAAASLPFLSPWGPLAMPWSVVLVGVLLAVAIGALAMAIPIRHVLRVDAAVALAGR